MVPEHYSFIVDLDTLPLDEVVGEQTSVDHLDGFVDLLDDHLDFDMLAPVTSVSRQTSMASNVSLGDIFGDEDMDWTDMDSCVENVPPPTQASSNAAPFAMESLPPAPACLATPPAASSFTYIPMPVPPRFGRPILYTPPTRKGTAPVLVKLSRPVLIEGGPLVAPSVPLSFALDPNLVWAQDVLARTFKPEARCKHKVWAAKKKARVHYGTSYVYENKASIARKRPREDGKFETRKMRRNQLIAEAQAAAAAEE